MVNSNLLKNMKDKNFDNNLISVITPVYNAAQYIGQTIESVLQQNYKNIEMFLIDDCSTDLSGEIIRKYCEKYENIYYYRLKRNIGAAAARNTALALSQGRYVAFLDSDDIWKFDKIKRQLALMKKKNSPFSYTAIEMINKDGKVVREKRKVKKSIDYYFLLKNTMIPTSSVLIDRKHFGDFRMPLIRSGQDYATWLKLLRNGARACGIDEALVQYRVRSGSLSANKLKSAKIVWQIQCKQEKINPIYATYNTGWFAWNALKKYLLI